MGRKLFPVASHSLINEWDKCQRDFSFADAELAWTSFEKSVRIFSYSRAKSNKDDRIHVTQKPIALYDWILKNYSKEGDTILDTHLGSGSSRISAYKMNRNFYGYEIDVDYFEKSDKRFNEEIKFINKNEEFF